MGPELALRVARVRHRDLEHRGDAHQLGQRPGFHLLHDLAAMDLDRDLADPQLGGRLLVEQPAHNQR